MFTAVVSTQHILLKLHTHTFFPILMIALLLLWIAFELFTMSQVVKEKIKTIDLELLQTQHSLHKLKKANLLTNDLLQQQLSAIKQQLETLESVEDKEFSFDKFELIMKLYENTLTTYTTIWQKL